MGANWTLWNRDQPPSVSPNPAVSSKSMEIRGFVTGAVPPPTCVATAFDRGNPRSSEDFLPRAVALL